MEADESHCHCYIFIKYAYATKTILHLNLTITRLTNERRKPLEIRKVLLFTHSRYVYDIKITWQWTYIFFANIISHNTYNIIVSLRSWFACKLHRRTDIVGISNIYIYVCKIIVDWIVVAETILIHYSAGNVDPPVLDGESAGIGELGWCVVSLGLRQIFLNPVPDAFYLLLNIVENVVEYAVQYIERNFFCSFLLSK